MAAICTPFVLLVHAKEGLASPWGAKRLTHNFVLAGLTVNANFSEEVSKQIPDKDTQLVVVRQ